MIGKTFRNVTSNFEDAPRRNAGPGFDCDTRTGAPQNTHAYQLSHGGGALPVRRGGPGRTAEARGADRLC